MNKKKAIEVSNYIKENLNLFRKNKMISPERDGVDLSALSEELTRRKMKNIEDSE